MAEFVSTISVRPKPDRSHRLILNFGKLNEHVAYHHFKTEYLKDTYYSSVHVMSGKGNTINILAHQVVFLVHHNYSLNC